MAHVLKSPDMMKRGVRQWMSTMIVFGDNGTPVTMLTVPTDTVCIVHNCIRDVIEIFDDSGTDLLNVGKAVLGLNVDHYCDDADTTMTAVALQTDVVTANFPERLLPTTTITAAYTGQNSDATAGQVVVEFEFTLMPQRN